MEEVKKEEMADYIPLGIFRFCFEVDFPDGAVIKTDKIFPCDPDFIMTWEMGEFLNGFMAQLGSKIHNRDLVPLVSISEYEYEPLLKFLKELREENGEDPGFDIEILGVDNSNNPEDLDNK